MPNNLRHFAVHADVVDRARKFYESVMDWQFTAWGPPGFFLIKTGSDENPGIGGALQWRREVVPGKPIFGFECTIGVDSIDDTITRVEANGGKIVMPKFHIPNCRHLDLLRRYGRQRRRGHAVRRVAKLASSSALACPA